MNVETAQVTRQGNRLDNQDRSEIVVSDTRLLLTVADGMGGHVGGDLAAETAVDALVQIFRRSSAIRDPADFLRAAVTAAHQAVVSLGEELHPELRPRTTITACVVSDGAACWAHVGDSRVYLIRDRRVLARTRDHSAVEILARQGLLDDADFALHPLRNFVDQCLGGDPALPTISVSDNQPLLAGDTLLLCSDGLWAPLGDELIAERLGDELDLQTALNALAEEAENRAAPASDNITAVALRWQD